ncbi:MAG: MoaD/ThiS family protein [Candidatus Latescibacterota bacterium]
MAVVWIPPLLQRHTGGRNRLPVGGSTVREVIASLEAQFPGMRDRLCTEDGRLRPEIAVAVDSEVVADGLRARVEEASEVHFLLALSGG